MMLHCLYFILLFFHSKTAPYTKQKTRRNACSREMGPFVKYPEKQLEKPADLKST